MFLRTEILPEMHFAGHRRIMSFADNKTFELWKEFGPQRKNIGDVKGTERYSIEIYSEGFFEPPDLAASFEKWAAVAVTDITPQDGFDMLTTPEGLYAVFFHKGGGKTAQKTYGYIFGEWLPGSGYILDNRPHLAIMGDKYTGEHEDSEEEIWIPIKKG